MLGRRPGRLRGAGLHQRFLSVPQQPPGSGGRAQAPRPCGGHALRRLPGPCGTPDSGRCSLPVQRPAGRAALPLAAAGAPPPDGRRPAASPTPPPLQSKRTKKVGIVGKYGTRYGASLRKQIKKIEVSQHSKYFCSFCGKVRRRGHGGSGCRRVQPQVAIESCRGRPATSASRSGSFYGIWLQCTPAAGMSKAAAHAQPAMAAPLTSAACSPSSACATMTATAPWCIGVAQSMICPADITACSHTLCLSTLAAAVCHEAPGGRHLEVQGLQQDPGWRRVRAQVRARAGRCIRRHGCVACCSCAAVTCGSQLAARHVPLLARAPALLHATSTEGCTCCIALLPWSVTAAAAAAAAAAKLPPGRACSGAARVRVQPGGSCLDALCHSSPCAAPPCPSAALRRP